MDAFEFIFSLFGLLLGLSMVEVFQGLIRTLKSRPAVHVGWLTPLLAILTLAHLTTFWDDAWNQRDSIPMNNISLFVGLLISGIYYYSASYVFPDRPDEWPDLDPHFDSARRKVLPGIVAAQLLSTGATMAMHGRTPTLRGSLVLIAFSGMLLAPAIVRGRKWSGITLAIATFVFLALAILSSLA